MTKKGFVSVVQKKQKNPKERLIRIGSGSLTAEKLAEKPKLTDRCIYKIESGEKLPGFKVLFLKALKSTDTSFKLAN